MFFYDFARFSSSTNRFVLPQTAQTDEPDLPPVLRQYRLARERNLPQPLIKLSLKYGISDVRLGKVCRELKIPHPGRGYWAKRKAGKRVVQLPLTVFEDAPIVRRFFDAEFRYNWGSTERREKD